MSNLNNYNFGSQTFEALNKLSWINDALRKYDSPLGSLAGIVAAKRPFENSMHSYTNITAIAGLSKAMSWHDNSIYNIGKSMQAAIDRQVQWTAVLGFSDILKNIQNVSAISDFYGSERLRNILFSQNRFSKTVSNIVGSMPRSRQLQSVALMYSGLSARIAIEAVEIDDEDTLDFIGELSNRVSESVAESYERGYLTREDLVSLRDYILVRLRSISKADWQFTISTFLAALSILVSIYCWANPVSSPDNTAKQPENIATQKDILMFQEELRESFRGTSKHARINKKLAIDVALKVKPSSKSNTIRVISKGATIEVWDISDDWAYIYYVDELDSLPACGWISTKYFSKPNFSKSFRERQKKTKHAVK